MIYTKPEMVLLAERAALDRQLRPELLCALIDISSAWRPETAEAQNLYVPPINQWDSLDIDEVAFRNYRWGLTQVLGSSARDIGFKAPLNNLVHPAENVQVGAAVLETCIRMTGGKIDRALVVWYGVPGSNFSSRVIAQMPKYYEFLKAPGRMPPLENLEPCL